MTTPNADPTAQAAVPYGTPEHPRVAVRGEARLEVDPEIARIGITVNARGTDRRAALDDLTRRNSSVLDLLKSYGDAVEKLESGSLVITPELTAKGRGERVRAYHGRVHVTASLTDFTTLGEVVTRLADLELTRVDGPWWALRHDSPAHREARRQAVRDAVQRAREYADALDARLVALVELADEGAETSVSAPRPPGLGGARAAYGAPAPQGEPPALDLEPRRQTVHAHVNARFIMSPPKL